MSTVSLAPTVRSTLHTLLDAALSGVSVYIAHPGGELPLKSVWFGEIRAGSHVIPTMKAGRKRREEEWDQEIIFEYREKGSATGAATAEVNAFAAMEELENILANDPNLGLTSHPTFRFTELAFESSLTNDEATRGWRCRLEVTVTFSNRIS